MKINDRGAKSAAITPAQNRAKELENSLKNSGTDATKNASALGGSAQVQVSTKAQAFQKAKAVASSDTIDEAKVARLQKLIDEGKYKVDAKAVADKLVDEHIATGE